MLSSCPLLQSRPYHHASHHHSTSCYLEGDHESLNSCSIACPEPAAFRELHCHPVHQTNFGKSYAAPSAI